MNGVIVIDKEKGFTSHDVVAKMRRILGTKKIGHTGTLDPDATGVLPVCIGNATKASDIMTGGEIKGYLAELRLGITTDTLDASGKVLESKSTEGITDNDIS
ncbi:MAG: tRNA pseudouridine(55) synthase, partial [Bacillota bacterium]|nr:tRNA pseudouridine(55) synthase [Bacillota bacterium]